MKFFFFIKISPGNLKEVVGILSKNKKTNPTPTIIMPVMINILAIKFVLNITTAHPSMNRILFLSIIFLLLFFSIKVSISHLCSFPALGCSG